MANGVGLGGFAQGLSQGINQGMGMMTAAQKYEADALALEQTKADAEADKEMRQRIADLEKVKNGIPGGVDDDGNQLPDVPKMGDAEYRLKQMGILNDWRIKTRKADIKDVQAMAEASKRFDFENLTEAANYAFTNPDDVEGIAKLFNKSGQKLPEGMKFQVVGDPNVPNSKNLIGFDSQGRQVFDFNMLSAAYLSPETRASMGLQRELKGAELKVTKDEGGANRQNRLDVQNLENKGKVGAAIAGREATPKQDPQEKAIEDMVYGPGKALAQSPNNTLYSAEYEGYLNKKAALATSLYRESGGKMSAASAVAMAEDQLKNTRVGGIKPPKK